ncbi:MAG: helix-turn-helix domain-containing protein [Firmicutes bacterium]|nr:helix-turn-helix domain-containing protein [Bacillota bacterium]
MPEKSTLKELRAKMDWTQEETAKKLGISLQTYNAWEQDFGNVKISSAEAIAKLFNVKLDNIFFSNKVENYSRKLEKK